MYCLCLREEESLDHLFLHCPFATKGWLALFKKFGVESCFPKNFGEGLLVVWEKSFGVVQCFLFFGALEGKKQQGV